MVSVVVVMPAFNEAAGITEFLEEICDAFRSTDLRVLIQDDCSSDDTAERVQALARAGRPVEVVRAATNQGHGPSTLAVLRRAVAEDPEVVIAVDGDGQFSGSDMVRLLSVCQRPDVEVVEGVRSGRQEVWYRNLATAGVRALVWARTGQAPRDANTPLRAYQSSTLEWLLDQLPGSLLTPNLHISSLVRTHGLRLVEEPVSWQVRRGGVVEGSTWGKVRAVPSRRLVRFMVVALRQWWRPPAPAPDRAGLSPAEPPPAPR